MDRLHQDHVRVPAAQSPRAVQRDDRSDDVPRSSHQRRTRLSRGRLRHVAIRGPQADGDEHQDEPVQRLARARAVRGEHRGDNHGHQLFTVQVPQVQIRRRKHRRHWRSLRTG